MDNEKRPTPRFEETAERQQLRQKSMENKNEYRKRETPQYIDGEKLRRDSCARQAMREEAYRQKQEAERQKQRRAETQAMQCANRSHPVQKQAMPSNMSAQSPIRPQMTKQQAEQHDISQEKAIKEREKRAFKKPSLPKKTALLKKPALPKVPHMKKNKEQGRKPLGRFTKKLLKLVWYVVLICCLLGAAFAALWMMRAHNAPTPIEEIDPSQQASVAMERAESNVYILVAGTDQRADEVSRSDTIIYTALRPVDRKIEMVSIPRDTRVDIPEVGADKINAAMAYGGMDLLSQTVENTLNNPVDHTVLVNFQSFARIIDAMGGIKMNVPQKMYLPEEGIDLEAGEQKLKGDDALAFVRWRGDGLGDIGRMERQSQFMQAVMDKMRHLPPWRILPTIWAISHEIETDMSMFDLLHLGWNFIGMDGNALEYQAFALDPTYIDGVSYVLLDDQNVNEVVQLMKYGIVIE